MKIFRRIIAIVTVILLTVIVSYLIFTGGQV